MDEMGEKTGHPEDVLQETLDSLMFGGIVVGTPSRSTGMMVYRLLGPFPGLFEYTNLLGDTDEKHKNTARLFEALFAEMRNFTQQNYDVYAQHAPKFPPIVCLLPVQEEIEIDAGDKIMPYEEVSRIIDK